MLYRLFVVYLCMNFLDQIHKIDVGSIQDEFLKNRSLLLLNGIELLQQENLELK